MKTQLLCTFTTEDKVDDIVDLIIACHDIIFDKIYIFSNKHDSNQMICTYNIEEDKDHYAETTDTISLHRKKQTNTLYTINALNEAIRSANGGELDKSFPLDWSKYTNSLLLTNDGGLHIVATKLYKIVNVGK
jgi:hypothetical protein